MAATRTRSGCSLLFSPFAARRRALTWRPGVRAYTRPDRPSVADGRTLRMPLPWSTELAGRIDEHVISSDLLRGNPLGDPYERPLLVYTPPGYDDAPDRRYPVGVRDPGVYRARGDVARTIAVPAAVPRDGRRHVRPRGGTARDRRVRGRVDRLWRKPVRRLAGHRELSLLSVRRGGPVGGRQVPDDPRCGTPGDRGQVERRLRRDDHADAPARPVRRPGHARRRRLLRVRLCA